MASDDTIKSMQLYQKLDSGATSPITPVIDLDQCQVGNTVANACTNLGISGITGSTSLPDFLIELCKKAVANSTQQSQIVGVTTQYAITTSAVTQDTIKQVGTWTDTAPTPTEKNPYLWKREATKYRTVKHETKNGKDTQITTEFYLDSNGNEIVPNNESLIPWIYTFCGARGTNGIDGVATQVTVYKSEVTGNKASIISDHTDPNWESQDYCPSGWQFSIPGVKAGYDIWKSSREKNKDGWTDFSTPTIYNSTTNTSTIATFILDPTQLTLELQASTSNECYYKIEFLNAVKEKYNLIITSKVKTSKEKAFKVSLPTGLMSKGYDTTSTTAISVYNEGNLLQLDTQYTITSNLGGFDPAKLVNYVQWFNCTIANVYCYSDAALSKVLSITNYVRTGMEGYYSKEDSSGKIIIYSTDSEITALNITAEGIRSTVSGKGANLVYGARCSKEAMQKQSINAGAYMQFITGSGIQYQTIDEKVVSTGDRINVVSGKIGFLVNPLVKGKTYTLQFMCCQYNSTKSDIKIKYSSSGNMTLPADSGFETIVADVPANWTTITCNECATLTFIAKESYNAFFLKGSFSIAKVQLEEGNAPTTWHDYNSGFTSSIIQQFDTIEQSVTNIENNSKSYLRVEDGHVKAYVEDEECKTGLDISKDGSTFTGKVSATNFEITKLTEEATDITTNNNNGVLWFTTGAVCKQIEKIKKGTHEGDIADTDPIMLMKNGDDLYYIKLISYFQNPSGYEIPNIQFYEEKTDQFGNVDLKRITVYKETSTSARYVYSSDVTKGLTGTYWTLIEGNVGIAVPADNVKNYFKSGESGPLYLTGGIYAKNVYVDGSISEKFTTHYIAKAYYPQYNYYDFIKSDGTKERRWKANSENYPSFFSEPTAISNTNTYSPSTTDTKTDDTQSPIIYKQLLEATGIMTETYLSTKVKGTAFATESITYYDTSISRWKTLPES